MDPSAALDDALLNCSKEPIHVPGAIQPFGVLFALDDATLAVRDCSINVDTLLGLAPSEVVSRPIGQLLPALAGLQRPGTGDFTPELPARIAGRGAQAWDAFLHRHRGQLILELERAAADEPPASQVNLALRIAITKIQDSRSLLELCQRGCEEIKSLTGLDGVMVYRFHPDEHGEVIAESKSEGFPKYLGLHYPASDIPRQARELFLSNWVRMIPDRDYLPVPLFSSTRGVQSVPLDLGRSLLRSVSRVHIEYLKNMGVKASLTISLIEGGRLWGLIAGHHYRTAKHVPFEGRAACETIGRLMSSQLAYRADQETAERRGRARVVQEQLAARAPAEDDLTTALVGASPNLLDLVEAAGASVLSSGGAWRSIGNVPKPSQIDDLVDWLTARHSERQVFHTTRLASHYPKAPAIKDVASGLLAIRIPKEARNYILLFKPEVIQTITWAGNPEKPVTYEGGAPTLHPRASFSDWKEEVRLTSLPWAAWELEAAEQLRASLLTIDLQRQFEAERAARAEADRANRYKEELMAVVSHDLKNPLNSIKLTVSLLLKTLPRKAWRRRNGCSAAWGDRSTG